MGPPLGPLGRLSSGGGGRPAEGSGKKVRYVFLYLFSNIFEFLISVPVCHLAYFLTKTRPEVYSCAQVSTLPLSESVIPEMAKI